jgi:hypothetical protein
MLIAVSLFVIRVAPVSLLLVLVFAWPAVVIRRRLRAVA